MAQLGLHLIVGFLFRWLFDEPYKDAWVLGNILPDIDQYAVFLLLLLSFIFPQLETWSTNMHRTLTHSLLVYFIFLILLFLYQHIWIHLFKTGKNAAHFIKVVMTIILGCMTHSFLDVAIWFVPTAVVWPLESFGIVNIANIWKNPPTEFYTFIMNLQDIVFIIIAYMLFAKLKLLKDDTKLKRFFNVVIFFQFFICMLHLIILSYIISFPTNHVWEWYIYSMVIELIFTYPIAVFMAWPELFLNDKI